MAGNKAGARAATKTVIDKHGLDEYGKSIFHSKQGAIGGGKKVPKGFSFSGKQVTAGRKGGKTGKRNMKYLKTENGYMHYLSKITGKTIKFKDKTL